MERLTQRDWFGCPRCGTQARQTWLSAIDGGTPALRWSICGACHRVTIWEGQRIVYPPAEAAEGVDENAIDPETLRALWDALGAHLDAQAFPAIDEADVASIRAMSDARETREG